jgi:hypothetical protein
MHVVLPNFLMASHCLAEVQSSLSTPVLFGFLRHCSIEFLAECRRVQRQHVQLIATCLYEFVLELASETMQKQNYHGKGPEEPQPKKQNKNKNKLEFNFSEWFCVSLFWNSKQHNQLVQVSLTTAILASQIQQEIAYH